MSPLVRRGDIITYISQIEFEKFKIIMFQALPVFYQPKCN
jgi:hypothetical protein